MDNQYFEVQMSLGGISYSVTARRDMIHYKDIVIITGISTENNWQQILNSMG